ncbi:MAG TPA: EAL domain-containing protein [Gammaproteobacteria bacterium]|nr:EAL domain-containing protein [Gammaproteobacteria bacterium]
MNFRTAILIAMILWLAHGAGILFGVDDRFRGLYSSFSWAVCSLAASCVLLWVVVRLRKTHPHFVPAWMCFGLSAVSYATADMLWTSQQLQSLEVPFPSINDYFYLGMYFFYSAGVLLLPKPRFNRGELLTYALDLLGMTLAFCLVWWELLFQPALQSNTFTSIGKVVAVSYVIFDVLLASALFLLLMRRNPYFIRQPMSLLMFSMAMMVSADIVYGIQNAAGTYRAGTLIDLGWSASLLSIMLAGCAQLEALGKLSDQEAIRLLKQRPSVLLPRWADNAPYLLLILGAIVAALHYQTGDTFLGIPLLLSAGLIVLLVVVRQSYSLYENRQLTSHLASALRERKQVEAWQQRHRALLEYLAGAPPLQAALTRIVLAIEQEVAGTICSILLVRGAVLKHGAAPGLPDFVIRAIDGLAIGPQAGSCGAAAHSGECVIAEDIYTHPNWGAYRELYRPTGLRSCWSLPIRSSTNEIIGTFAVYRRTPGAPTAAEIEQVKSYAHMASLAIERVAKEADVRLAADVFAESGEMILIMDMQQRILRVNRTFSEVTGFSDDDVLGQPLNIIVSERREPGILKTLQTALSENGRWYGELWCKRKAGGVFPTWLNISAAGDEASSVSHYIAVLADISTLKASESRIEFLAHHDALTGLPNRTLLQTRFEQAQAQADRDRSHVALMFLDLDYFKNINDSLGHTVGDKLLQKVADTLKSCLRQSDTVCRLGGDEFLILLPDVTDSDITVHVASKLQEGLCQSYEIEGHHLATSCSIGISLYPDDGRDYITLLKNADTAMYYAKNNGRNTYHFFTESMNVVATRKMRLENQMRRALQCNEFTLHYQPIIELRSGKLMSAEALLRWDNPDFSDVSPSSFIPVAEDRMLIQGISEWVLLHACEQIKYWREANVPIPAVSVNLSAHDFRRKNLLSFIVGILEGTRLSSAGCLELEITETVLMADVDASIRTLRELAELGINISVDDFGTGYSSLSYLKLFPLNKLKIDRSFIKDLTTDSNDRGIVNAIVHLGNNLGLSTVAEGVETAPQQEFLLNVGCAQAQGYFIAPPLPPQKLLDWMQARGYWSNNTAQVAGI